MQRLVWKLTLIFYFPQFYNDYRKTGNSIANYFSYPKYGDNHCSSRVSQLATKAKVAIAGATLILSKARVAYFTFFSHVTSHPVRELFQPPLSMHTTETRSIIGDCLAVYRVDWRCQLLA